MPGVQFFDSKECEWADMSITIEGANLVKIRSIKYSVSQEVEALYAAGDEPISLQTGNRTYKGELKILKGALDNLNLAARTAGGRDILDIPFEVGITYAAQGTRLLQTDALINCRITEFEKGWEQGAKMMEITVPIIFIGIRSI